MQSFKPLLPFHLQLEEFWTRDASRGDQFKQTNTQSEPNSQSKQNNVVVHKGHPPPFARPPVQVAGWYVPSKYADFVTAVDFCKVARDYPEEYFNCPIEQLLQESIINGCLLEYDAHINEWVLRYRKKKQKKKKNDQQTKQIESTKQNEQESENVQEGQKKSLSNGRKSGQDTTERINLNVEEQDEQKQKQQAESQHDNVQKEDDDQGDHSPALPKRSLIYTHISLSLSPLSLSLVLVFL